MKVGVFYRVYYNPPRKEGTSRVLNFDIPDDADPHTFPILNAAREKISPLHPDAKHFTIIATSPVGPILIDENPRSAGVNAYRYMSEYQIRTPQGWSVYKPISLTLPSHTDAAHVFPVMREFIRAEHKDKDLKDKDIFIKPFHAEAVHV